MRLLKGNCQFKFVNINTCLNGKAFKPLLWFNACIEWSAVQYIQLAIHLVSNESKDNSLAVMLISLDFFWGKWLTLMTETPIWLKLIYVKLIYPNLIYPKLIYPNLISPNLSSPELHLIILSNNDAKISLANLLRSKSLPWWHLHSVVVGLNPTGST